MSDDVTFRTSQIGIQDGPWIKTVPPNELPQGGARGVYAVSCVAFTQADTALRTYYYHPQTHLWTLSLVNEDGTLTAVVTQEAAEDLLAIAQTWIDTTRPFPAQKTAA